MKTKRFFFGLPAVLLALGLVLATSLTLAGCGEEEEESGGGSSATATITWPGQPNPPKVGETLTATCSGFNVGDIHWRYANTATGAWEGGTIQSTGPASCIMYSGHIGYYIWVVATDVYGKAKAESARVGPVAAAN